MPVRRRLPRPVRADLPRAARPSRPPPPRRRRGWARNVVASVFRNVGLRVVCATCSSRTATHAPPPPSGRARTRRWAHRPYRAWRARHTIKTVKRGRTRQRRHPRLLNSFDGESADDWPALVPLVGFAINDLASPRGSGHTPFVADHGQCLPLAALPPPALPPPMTPRGQASAGEDAACLQNG